MTLEEAIRHAEEVVEEKVYEYQECLAVYDTESARDCVKCGEEHRQFAEWLKELKERKAKDKKGEWLRMSNLSEKDDDRYKCSRCGNVTHSKSSMDLYTYNRWCGRCGSDNSRHTTIIEADKWEEDAPVVIEAEGEE